MPQTLSLADLQSAPAPAPATGQTLTIDDLAPAPAPAAKPEPAWEDSFAQPQAKAGAHFFKEMYDEGIAPMLKTVKDAWDRGDVGEHAVTSMLRGFHDQLWNWQTHPDIRNAPLIGTGATGVSRHAQDLWNKGDYVGAFGAMSGFISAFFAPEALNAALAKLPEAQRAAAIAADTTGNLARAAADATRGALETVSAATDPAVVRAAIKVIPKGSAALEAWDTFQGVRDAARRARAAEAPPAVIRESPAWADIGTSPVTTSDFAPAPAAALPSGRVPGSLTTAEARAAVPAPAPPQRTPLWSRIEASPAGAQPAFTTPAGVLPSGRVPGSYAAAQAAAQAAEPAITVTPFERAQGDVLDVAPEAREFPPLTAAQLLEDRIHEHHAYLLGQAEDIIWANRARKADRFAQWLIENKLPATPENIDLAAKRLAERTPPSDETVPMIQDRVDWFNGSKASAAVN